MIWKTPPARTVHFAPQVSVEDDATHGANSLVVGSSDEHAAAEEARSARLQVHFAQDLGLDIALVVSYDEAAAGDEAAAINGSSGRG